MHRRSIRNRDPIRVIAPYSAEPLPAEASYLSNAGVRGLIDEEDATKSEIRSPQNVDLLRPLRFLILCNYSGGNTSPARTRFAGARVYTLG